MKSGYCNKCRTKYEVIEYMLLAFNDKKYGENEQKYLEHFNKSKGKPGQPMPQELEINARDQINASQISNNGQRSQQRNYNYPSGQNRNAIQASQQNQ